MTARTWEAVGDLLLRHYAEVIAEHRGEAPARTAQAQATLPLPVPVQLPVQAVVAEGQPV